jgi:hypothetical protein
MARSVIFEYIGKQLDRLCGLVVGVPGYRYGGPGFDSRALQGKKKVVGLERGPLSLVSTTEELLGRKSSGSGLESREYGRRDSSRWPRGTFYPKNVSTNFADKRRSLGRVVHLRTKATEFFLKQVQDFTCQCALQRGLWLAYKFTCGKMQYSNRIQALGYFL